MIYYTKILNTKYIQGFFSFRKRPIGLFTERDGQNTIHQHRFNVIFLKYHKHIIHR